MQSSLPARQPHVLIVRSESMGALLVQGYCYIWELHGYSIRSPLHTAAPFRHRAQLFGPPGPCDGISNNV